MDVFQNEVQWSSRLEHYFCQLGEKALCLSYLHKKCESRFTKKSTYIDLPVIVLSTIAGTLSIGSSSLFQGNEQLASVGVGSLSLVVGVLNTVNSYFAFNRRAENHKLCFIQFGKLHRFLEIEMALPREQRIKAKDLLKFVREQYERLQEVAPLIPKDIINQFRKKYKNINIAQPEISQGPQPIKVFRNDISTPGPKGRRGSFFTEMHGTIDDEPFQDESEPTQSITPNNFDNDDSDSDSEGAKRMQKMFNQANAMNLTKQIQKIQSKHPPLPSKIGIVVDPPNVKQMKKFMPKELKAFKKKTENKLKKFKKAADDYVTNAEDIATGIAGDAIGDAVGDVMNDVVQKASEEASQQMENTIVEGSKQLMQQIDNTIYELDEGDINLTGKHSLKKGAIKDLKEKMLIEEDDDAQSQGSSSDDN